jgi:hypothetical protein
MATNKTRVVGLGALSIVNLKPSPLEGEASFSLMLSDLGIMIGTTRQSQLLFSLARE